MAKEYIDYVKFDEIEASPISEVSCMACGTQLGVRKLGKKTGALKLVYFNTLRRPRVVLTDGTYADLLICEKCYSKPLNLKKLDKSMRNGWMTEENWKYCTSTNPKHRELKKKIFNLNPDDPLPLSYFKRIFKGKKILKKGAK